MGCDISILSRHNLDLSNVETLAYDLAERLKINIDFGYYASKEYNSLLKNNFEDGLIILGSVLKNKTNERYLLKDENYQQKELYQKFGDQLFDMDDYWYWIDSIPTEQEKLQEKKDILVADYYLDNIEITGAAGYLSIYNEIVSNNLYYYTRWWDFCRTMQNTEFNDALYGDHFQNYRTSVMKSTLALGGEKAYFVNDQCK